MPCKVPPQTCKAYSLAEALLACQKGAPGIGAAIISGYVSAVQSTRQGLGRILKTFSPATKALVRRLRPQVSAFSEDGRDLGAKRSAFMVTSWGVGSRSSTSAARSQKCSSLRMSD